MDERSAAWILSHYIRGEGQAVYRHHLQRSKRASYFKREVVKRAPCIAGRATTCGKAYREGDESKVPLVIKDSWQDPEREEEGELLREATEKAVINVARYYHYETVRVGSEDDDVCNSMRKGLDITKATNYNKKGSIISPNTPRVHGTPPKGRSTAGRKRSSSCVNALLLLSERTCSSSPTKDRGNPSECDRVHRRFIVRDYGNYFTKQALELPCTRH